MRPEVSSPVKNAITAAKSSQLFSVTAIARRLHGLFLISRTGHRWRHCRFGDDRRGQPLESPQGRGLPRSFRNGSFRGIAYGCWVAFNVILGIVRRSPPVARVASDPSMEDPSSRTSRWAERCSGAPMAGEATRAPSGHYGARGDRTAVTPDREGCKAPGWRRWPAAFTWFRGDASERQHNLDGRRSTSMPVGLLTCAFAPSAVSGSVTNSVHTEEVTGPIPLSSTHSKARIRVFEPGPSSSPGMVVAGSDDASTAE